MQTYAVYQQFFPLTVRQANPRRGIEAEYEANIVLRGRVEAESGEDAMAQARMRFGLHAPIVERVLH